ncbi:MAG TPA: PAS domain S-box protein [Ramlibacter sp.]|jgi:PAS domain S-box-containing protein|uniref:PAS domain S-box protein n=1 Tax=Ramlibacter sp. TaxID=1917967 RepID=UPI002D362955|nr:PAS domain S-box protein [Ramlibacter sp.]HZY17720.1 PAS domain S-box protein [Ramlibacter sp.]
MSHLLPAHHPPDAGALATLADLLRALPDRRPDRGWLARVAERLEAPRCTWALVGGQPLVAQLQLEHRAGALVATPQERVRAGALRKLQAGELLILDRLADVAPEDLPPLHAPGVMAAMVVPVFAGGLLAGLLTLQAFAPRRWSREEVAYLAQAAGLVAHGLQPSADRRGSPDEALLYRRLLDDLPSAAAFVVDPDLRYRVAAGGALKAAGLQPGDLLGKTVHEAFGPAIAQQMAADYQTALQGSDFHNEHEFLGRHYETHGTPLRDAHGRIAGAIAVSHVVTNRVLAERRVRDSEQRYRHMFEANPHPMWMFDDVTLKFLAVNDAACRVYGWTAEEFLQMTLDDIRQPEDVPRLRERLLAQPWPLPRRGSVVRHRIRSGAMIDVEIASHPLELDGRAVRLVLAHDITERLRAEQLLRESEATLRSFYASAAQLMGVVEVAEDERDILHVYDNPASEAFFGSHAGATTGRWSSELGIARDVIVRWSAHYLASRRTGRPVRFESQHAIDGRELWLAVTVAYIGVASSGRPRFSYVAEDFTERKLAERRISEGEQRLALALRAGQLGFFDLDVRTGHVHYGGYWAGMLGRRLEDIPPTQEAWSALVHPEDLPRVLAASHGHMEGGASAFRIEHRMRHADGSWRWVLSRGEVVQRDARGRAVRVLGIHADITDRRRSEEALRLADRRKDEFLAVLAHELRNPLAPVRTAVEILRRSELREPRMTSARDVIERQVNHMVRLIDDLLDVARITHGKVELQPALVPLQSVVRMAVETAQPNLLAAHQSLALDLPEQAVWVHGDPVRLSQVVLNLLNNASKYTAQGGAIRLRLRTQGQDALVEVADSGIGIDAEALERLFEMFSQVHDKSAIAAGGLGVGLALSRAIVQLHGGRISASSPGLGQGSTFAVQLPTMAAPQAPVADEGGAGGTAAQERLRVLVADDSADAAETLAVLLELMGHETRTASGGRQAVDVVAAWEPQLVLLDLGMPDLDGCAACRAIRALPLRRQPVVVALTGWGQDEDRRRTADAGFDGHLVKPVDEAELLPFFELAARGRAGANPGA